MVLHRALFGAVAAAALAVGLTVAAPAGPAVASDTTTTFTVTGGSIGISSPASKALGAGGPSTSITTQLGAVTATDSRGLLAASWTATAATSDFENVDTPAAAPVTTLTYASGLPTSTSGTAVFLPGQAVVAAPSDLSSTPVAAFSASATVGNNSATWNPTVVVSLPAQVITGAYSGTITHSVS